MSDSHTFLDQHRVLENIAPSRIVKQTGELFGRCRDCHALDEGTCPILDIADAKGFDGMPECEMYKVLSRVFKSGISFEHFGHRKDPLAMPEDPGGGVA